jgi:hypothetical protein
MSHLTKALRALACYEHDDMSIGDEAADEIECQQAEIKRLRAALTYEENRFNRVGTHDPNCYTWGPGHYECALREIEQLRQRLHEVSVDWQCGQAREAKLREALGKIATNTIHWYASIQDAKAALALPTDDTALKEVLRSAKREVLLEAAEAVIKDAARIGSDWVSAHHADTLRKMAGEIK